MIEPTEQELPRTTEPDDSTALLIEVVYEELRRLAYHALAREPEAPTLQPTALVHEVYLRLRAERSRGWANRAQFFHAAATAMRRILVEGARRRRAQRHGGGCTRQKFAAELLAAPDAGAGLDLLELEVALEDLRLLDEQLFALVELRYFAGLTSEEAAAVLGRSVRSVRRDWQTARLFLFERIKRRRAEGEPRAC